LKWLARIQGSDMQLDSKALFSFNWVACGFCDVVRGRSGDADILGETCWNELVSACLFGYRWQLSYAMVRNRGREGNILPSAACGVFLVSVRCVVSGDVLLELLSARRIELG
jgi:hypothetical protein